MATFPHLPLERLERNVDRRRVPSPVGPPQRSAPAHAAQIQTKIDNAVAEQSAVPQIEGIDPELILKVSLASPVQEDSWRTSGLRVLAQEPNNILVLFFDDVELREFRTRLAQYQADVPEGRLHPAYNSLFASIDDIGGVSSNDRIGPRLRSEGIYSRTTSGWNLISASMSNLGCADTDGQGNPCPMLSSAHPK